LGREVYVEAVVVTFLSASEGRAEARKNAVYDILNRLVIAPNWFLWLEIEGAPATQPPARQIARFLNDKLESIDAPSVAAAYAAHDLEGIPAWQFGHEDWSITFRPIPRRPDASHKSDHRPLGMFSSGFHTVDHRTPLRDAVLDKVTAYGQLPRPLVVAVHPLEPIDDIDIGEALFGKENFLVATPELGSQADPEVTPRRTLDGVWTLHSGPRNTRLGAVLIASRLYPWAISACSFRLYHNPWASASVASDICALPQAIPEQGTFRMIDGLSVADLLFHSAQNS
jgi:hypothetical protein